MEVEITFTRFIKPSSPTPTHLKTYKISLLDQFVPATHTPMILYYHNQEINLISERSMLLKQSLSETLTHYYPFAGRIKDTLSIDCNDEGACYIEARANIPLSEYLTQPHLPSMNKLLPCKGNCYKPDPTRSYVTMVQETIFACGSIAIGVLVSHLIVDGNGLASFLRNWAATACKSSKLDIIHPNFDGPCIFPQYEAFSEDATMLSLCVPFFKIGKFGTRRFVFGEWSMAKLKAEAAASSVENPTRFEVVSAFLFECIAAVLKKRSSGIDRTNAYLFAVNLRRRANPPISRSSLGNFVWLSNVLCSPEEVKAPLSVLKLREAIKKIDSEFVKNIRIGGFNKLYEKVKETRIDLTRSENGVNFVLMTSWCNFGLCEVDFGWGKPIWVTCAPLSADSAIPYENSIVLMDAGMGKGIEAWVFMEEEDLVLLEKHQHLLQYASLNPSPLKL